MPESFEEQLARLRTWGAEEARGLGVAYWTPEDQEALAELLRRWDALHAAGKAPASDPKAGLSTRFIREFDLSAVVHPKIVLDD